MGTRRIRRFRPPAVRPAPGRGRAPSRGFVAARRSGRSPSGAYQLAGDDDALDLVGPLVDLASLRVADAPRHWIFLEVAIAAEDLQGIERDLHRGVSAEEF